MMATLRRLGRRFAFLVKSAFDHVIGSLLVLILRAVRHFDRLRVSNAFARVTRTIGPWLPEHRLGRANLTAAFPEKPPEEIERILTGVWDNLGRVVAEFAHLDRLVVGDPHNLPFVKFDAAAAARFDRIRDDGKAALVFASHLGNWELPAIVAHAFGLDAMVLYRRPNVGAVADAVIALREGHMGTLVPTDSNAPIRLARGLEAGKRVAMLVDQHYGRRCKTNPLIAALARHVECPIYGTRVVRLPGGAFRAEVTDPIEPARDAEGRVDVQGTMQAITNVVEGWVREHPEQWLWLHRRWRD
jgi:KDO2-lipid IV(A) lauroyltransferase